MSETIMAVAAQDTGRILVAEAMREAVGIIVAAAAEGIAVAAEGVARIITATTTTGISRKGIDLIIF